MVAKPVRDCGRFWQACREPFLCASTVGASRAEAYAHELGDGGSRVQREEATGAANIGL